MKVSIIIPCYNAEKYIPQTIQSILDQSFTDWELIIIDDGSTDNSKYVIQPFLSNNNIQYYFQANQGVSAARNNGAKIAQGNFLAFLDADDIWHEDFLKEMTTLLEDSPNNVLANGNAQQIDKEGVLKDVYYSGHSENAIDSILTFKSDHGTFPSNTLCRKDAFEKIGGFNLSLSNVADKMFFLDMANIGKIKHIDKVLLHYREYPDSMHNNLTLMIEDYLRLYSILKSKGYFYNNEIERIFLHKIYRIIAGGHYHLGQYISCVKYLFKMILKRYIK